MFFSIIYWYKGVRKEFGRLVISLTYLMNERVWHDKRGVNCLLICGSRLVSPPSSNNREKGCGGKGNKKKL